MGASCAGSYEVTPSGRARAKRHHPTGPTNRTKDSRIASGLRRVRPSGWCQVHPHWLAADGEQQSAVVGGQAAGRAGFFLRVDDFDAAHRRMANAGVRFMAEPRRESYGRVAVFLDLLGPA